MSYERFAEALLATEVASRDAHGGQARIRAARFLARKTLEEFDFSFQRSVQKTLVLHLGQLDFLAAKDNVVLLGPPGPGSHCAQTSESAEVSPGKRPITFVRRRTSTKVRSKRSVLLIRLRCSEGKRRWQTSASTSRSITPARRVRRAQAAARDERRRRSLPHFLHRRTIAAA